MDGHRLPPSSAAAAASAARLHPHHQRSASAGSHIAFNNLHFSLPGGAVGHHQGVGGGGGTRTTGSPDPLSDDDDHDWGDGGGGVLPQSPDELQGTLSKWTNYIHGWQDRYIALKEGTLVYFKSEIETDFGCRGAISIDKATVKQHEVDDLRFDVSVSDCVWYLRATSIEDRQRWIEGIEGHKRYAQELSLNGPQSGGLNDLSGQAASNSASAASLPPSLRRHDSALSLTSTASKGGFARGQHARSLAEKLAEIETFRDILCRQIETLQSYFEACANVATQATQQNGKGGETVQAHSESQSIESQSHHNASSTISNDLVRQHGIHAVDFKGEAITFKATTAGIVATMSHCIDLMNQREEQWKKKLEREQTARRRIEERYKHMVDQRGDQDKSTCSAETFRAANPTPTKASLSGTNHQANPPSVSSGAPNTSTTSRTAAPLPSSKEYEESVALSQIGEDEFFDAVENALDKLQEEQDYRDKMKLMSLSTQQELPGVHSEATQHQLWPTIDKVTKEQLHYARMEVDAVDGVWELFAEDGEMRMYKREEEKDGLVVDPLKALHSVRGVTARELCTYFFEEEYRMEWETTVEQVSVLEKLAPDTLIFLQLHKRVWPAAQRDALFWSHIRQMSPNKEAGSGPEERVPDDVWMVCNQSTKHPDGPENQGGCLRVGLTVCFVCDTYVDPPFTKETASRANLHTKITYCSVVNPGGWAPAAVLRSIFKREYPRFLKRFTQYVIDKSKNQPIMW